MATYLSVVNSVMARMREPQVASVNESEYSILVGELVKQANSEVEDAWNWHMLRSTVQVVTQADSYDYALTGAGTSFDVLQVFEDTEDYDLARAPSYQWMNRRLLANDPSTGAPTHWDWNGRDSNGDPVANLWPIPDQPYTVNFNMKIKTVLDADTDDIVVAQLPVVLRAAQLAVEERGDDGGASASTLAQQASAALSDAIAYDANMYVAEQTWELV